MTRSLRDPRGWLMVICALALTAACSSEPRHDVELDSVGPKVRAAADLSTVMRNAALAYRREAGRFASGGLTFVSSVDPRGAIAVTPRLPESAMPGPPRGTPLTLETSHVERGGHVFTEGPAAARLERDGTVSIPRGEIEERVANDDAGVEQSWRFERAPQGEGDLVVHVRATGERYSGATAHGLHFAGSDGDALGLRYGTATWIDAAGRRTTVRPVFANGEIVLRVPASVIAGSRYPAVLDPTVTAEKEADAPIAGASAGGEQYSPVIQSAGPGKGYLAIWFDARGVRPSLYGSRLGSDGTVMDEGGIVIATGVSPSTPQLTAAADGYLVSWSVPYVDIYQPPGLYAVRLDAAGKPLDPAPLTIVANQQNVRTGKAAFDGTNWLLAYQKYGGVTSYDIEAVRVARSGAPVDATPIPVSKDPGSDYEPLVQFDGTDYLVMWRSSLAIRGQKISKAGAKVGTLLTLATTTVSSPTDLTAVFDGTQHLLVWREYRSSPTYYDIFARRVAKSGVPIDATPIAVSNDANYDYTPRVAFDGTNYLVTWRRSPSLMARRVTPAGVLLDGTGITLASGNYYDYSVASDGQASLVVSRETVTPSSGSDIRGLMVAKTPAGGATPFTVSKGANSQRDVSVAFDGVNHYAVWVDTRDPTPSIYGARVAPDGTAQAPVKLVSDAKYPQLQRARVAGDADGFLVVFATYDSTLGQNVVRGVRVGANGQPAAGEIDIRVPPATGYEYAYEADVAVDGTNYMVVWARESDEGQGIAGMRIPRSGNAPVDQEPLKLSAVDLYDYRSSPSVGFDGTSYFVAWMTSRYSPAGIDVSHIYGTRVSKEGTVLDGEAVVCDAFLLQRAPRVTGDAKNGGFFVVWEDFRTALENADVYGARIGSQGENRDGTKGLKIAAGTHDESRPHAAASGDGTNWVVAWRDLRSKQTYDVYGAWVSVNGTNHDPEGFLLSAEGGDEDAPWLSTSSPGKLLLSYQRVDPRPGYGSYRFRARAIDSGAPVASACTQGGECASRSCVDGVCCLTECGGCGTCSAQPGTCTPRPAGSESPTCPNYRCKGALECPAKCENDGDCASNATCDPATKTCVSRVLCVNETTLKDLTGKLTDCAPFKCVADACRLQCGSVDDCAPGFVCDHGGRCVVGPGGDDGGCATAGPSSSGSGTVIAASVVCIAIGAGLRRRRRAT